MPKSFLNPLQCKAARMESPLFRQGQILDCLVFVSFSFPGFGGEIIVVDFYGKNDDRTEESDDVGYPKRPYIGKEAQHHEECGAEAHHHESGHRDAVGIACADSGICLGHIP